MVLQDGLFDWIEHERLRLVFVVRSSSAKISVISLTSLTHCVAPKVLGHKNSLVSLYLIAYSFAREPFEYEY